jgi:hypothetical protein
MFEHCAFREGLHRAYLGTPWGLRQHMGLGSPMWCHTACGTTWDAQCGATRPVAPHAAPNVVPHSLWHHMGLASKGTTVAPISPHMLERKLTGITCMHFPHRGSPAIFWGSKRGKHMHRRFPFKFWGLWVQPSN